MTASDGHQIRIMLVEDEGLYRDLLRIVLAQHGRFVMVGAFGDGEEAIRAAPALRPDVAILDIDLGKPPNGVQVGLQIREALPNLGIVLLSNHGDPQFLAGLPRGQVAGWSYLLKHSVSDVEALNRAIEGAASQLVVLDPNLVTEMHPRPESGLARLTPRQAEILGLIAQGYTNAAIAQKLVVAEKSVENQINQMYQQLGVERRNSSAHPRVSAVLRYLEESYFRGPTVPAGSPRSAA